MKHYDGTDGGTQAMQEFNQLANLIGLAAASRGDARDEFKINLFPEAESVDSSGKLSYQVAGDVVNIDLGPSGGQAKKALQEFEDLKIAAQANTGDDLLDLMDNLD